MGSYIIRRILLAVIVLIIATLLVFITTHVLPGDPVFMMISSSEASSLTPAELAAIRHEYGLDKSLPAQYIAWLGQVVFHRDFGKSILMSTPVSQLWGERIPVSLHLGLVAFAIGVPVGILSGVVCAIRRGTWIDTIVTSLANIGMCIPVFWLAILLIYFIGLELGLLPVYGYTAPWKGFWISTQQSIMPIFCLAIGPIAMNCRLTRSSMLEVIRQDYIRTAWSKGLKERVIVLRHALKNGIIPVITMLGMGVTFIIGGSVLIEQVFAIPGMGRMTTTAMLGHDYPIIQGNVVLFSSIVLLSNLLVDLCYGWLDPRVRYR
jgi:peptide/nickel transport system permease protein